MPAGDLLTRRGQIDLGGELLIGSGTAYPVQAITGLGIPAAVTDDRPRSARHGSYSAPEWLPGRDLVVNLGITAADRLELQDLADALASAVRPRPSSTVEVAIWHGRDARLTAVRMRPLDLPVDDWTPWGLARRVVLSLHAPDPFLYGLTPTDDTVTIPASATSSGSTVVTNAGNAPSSPTLSFTGPATDPRIANAAAADGAGAELRFSGTITAGQTVDVDVAAREVRLDGALDYSILAADAEWWDLEPGDNPVTFARDDTPATSATLTVTHRPAYLTGI